MNDYRIREARPCDAIRLAPRLRMRDVEEIRAASGDDPMTALLRCASESPIAWTAEDHEGPFVMFGVAPYMDDVGSPWLLGADRLVTQYLRAFLRESKHYIKVMHTHYPMLVNYVDARQLDSLKYLRRAGFSIDKFLPTFGHERRPFYRFSKVV